MKSWLGVVGRACIEFSILLLLVSFIAGAAYSIDAASLDPMSFARAVGLEARELIPLVAFITLFLTFFSFDNHVPSRSAGYLGLLIIGCLTLALGIGLRRIPLASSTLSEVPSSEKEASERAAQELALPPPTLLAIRGSVGLWYGGLVGDKLVEVVATDFAVPYPRLAYAGKASYDGESGKLRIGERDYSLLQVPGTTLGGASAEAGGSVRSGSRAFLPEAASFEGSWIWQRIAREDEKPLIGAAVIAGGFLLFAMGFRFLGRVTGWPLANALLCITGLIVLLAADAALGSPSLAVPIGKLLAALGIATESGWAVATLEAVAGLLLTGLDMLMKPREKGVIDG